MSVQRFGAFLMTLLLAGCSRSPDDTRITVEYFRAHAGERRATLMECANDPGALRKSPVCTNAREAARIEDVGNLRNLPPMGLTAAPGTNTNGNGPR
jgi:hypothetical protein